MIKRLFGGGAEAPAEPIKDLAAALPDESQIVEARDLERGKANAAEYINKLSPELQVKMFAGMSDEDRLQADLSLLTPDQQGWLIDMSNDQLKHISETGEQRIAAALRGEKNALTAIRSVGQVEEPAPDTQTVLERRITACRAAKMDTAPPSYAVN